MQSYLHIRALGLILALNLVACAHEIPLGSGDVAEQDSVPEMSEEQIADRLWEDQVRDDAEQVAAGEAAPAEQTPTVAQTDVDDAAVLAELEDISKAVSNDLEPAMEAPTAVVAQAPDSQEMVAKFKQVAAANVSPDKATIRTPQSEAPTQVQAQAKRAVQAPFKNRYYVVRAGDNAEYVSMLIYKNTDRATQLQVWNGPAAQWSAGTVLYYVSPEKPRDRKMLSFYEERNLVADSITVQAGDSLAALAEKRLGSSLSSREIALVNGMREDEPLKPGKVLKMYPSPLLGGQAQAPAVAAVQVAPTAPVAAAAPAMVAAAPAPQPAAEAIPTVVEKSSSVRGPAIITLAPAAPEKPKASLASTVMSTLFNHHPLVLACVITLLSLFAAFFYLQRKNGGSPYDF